MWICINNLDQAIWLTIRSRSGSIIYLGLTLSSWVSAMNLSILEFGHIHFWLTLLGFNITPTLVGHLMSSPREREKRDREGQERKRNRSESGETEEIKTFPFYLTWYKDSRPCPTVSQYQLDAPVTWDTWHLCTTRPPLTSIVANRVKNSPKPNPLIWIYTGCIFVSVYQA